MKITNAPVDRVLTAAQNLIGKPLCSSEIKILNRVFGPSKLGSPDCSKRIILH